MSTLHIACNGQIVRDYRIESTRRDRLGDQLLKDATYRIRTITDRMGGFIWYVFGSHSGVTFKSYHDEKFRARFKRDTRKAPKGIPR